MQELWRDSRVRARNTHSRVVSTLLTTIEHASCVQFCKPHLAACTHTFSTPAPSCQYPESCPMCAHNRLRLRTPKLGNYFQKRQSAVDAVKH